MGQFKILVLLVLLGTVIGTVIGTLNRLPEMQAAPGSGSAWEGVPPVRGSAGIRALPNGECSWEIDGMYYPMAIPRKACELMAATIPGIWHHSGRDNWSWGYRNYYHFWTVERTLP